MTYAIISLGGKQYRVREGERLLVDRLPTEEGKTFHPEVLMLGGDGAFELAPKAQVTARVVGSPLGEKIRIGKYKPSPATVATPASAPSSRRSRSSRSAAPSRRQRRAKKEEAPAAPAKLPGGYADMTVADIKEKFDRWTTEQVEAALEYERAHAKRKGALAALEARKEHLDGS
jgi:large subunit ribosomal protein L21